MKGGFENIELGGDQQVIEGGVIFPLDDIGEVGMDADQPGIGDDEQGGILEGFAVPQKLIVGGFEGKDIFVAVLDGVGMTDQRAEIVEAGLVEGALFEIGVMPFGAEFLRVHGEVGRSG